MCCRSDFNSVSSCLPSNLAKSKQKREFLDIYLTTYFGVRNFKNTSVMGVIFFLKMVKIESKFRKSKKTFRKYFELSVHGSIYMVKWRLFRFQQCFSLLTMLFFEGSSEMGLFRHLSNHIFWSL